MLSVAAARTLLQQHLGTSRVVAHSLFVGDLMAVVADALDQDSALWRLTGYCHDLDMIAVAGAMEQHGPMTASWLDGQLPPQALAAIAAHDHRAGRVAEFPLAWGLRLCDATAVLDATLGRSAADGLRREAATTLVLRQMPGRPWIGTMIDDLCLRLDLSLHVLADCLEKQKTQQHPGP